MPSAEEKAVKYTIRIGIVFLIIFAVFLVINKPEGQKQSVETQDEAVSFVQTVIDNAPTQGSSKIGVVLIEYGDFQCPFCKDVSPIIDEIMNEYPGLIQRFWIHTPNNAQHPEALNAAVASQCANEQDKFWEYHDQLFEQQENLSPTLYLQISQNLKLNEDLFKKCLVNPETSDLVRAHNQLASRSNVDATPHVALNDVAISGVFTLEQLDSLVQEQLALIQQ